MFTTIYTVDKSKKRYLWASIILSYRYQCFTFRVKLRLFKEIAICGCIINVCLRICFCEMCFCIRNEKYLMNKSDGACTTIGSTQARTNKTL